MFSPPLPSKALTARPVAGLRLGQHCPCRADAVFARVQLSAEGKALAAWVDDLQINRPRQHCRRRCPSLITTVKPWPTCTLPSSGQRLCVRSTYTVQLVTNPEFSPLLTEAHVTAPFMTADLPAFDTHDYFWRVKANNGGGESAWSPVWSLVARQPARFYNDEFSGGVLDNAWSWQTTAPAGGALTAHPIAAVAIWRSPCLSSISMSRVHPANFCCARRHPVTLK